MFLLYVWLGSMFNTILNWSYFCDTFNEFSGKSILLTFMPLFALMLGMLSLKTFFFVFTNSVCLILSLLMFVYFGINLRMVLNGQTWNENAKNIQTYNIDWKFNLRLVLGRRWYLAIINAFSQSALFGDGTSFRKREELPNQRLDDIPSQWSTSSSPFNIPKRRVI